MIDEGETDWKILCIDVNDPNAQEYSNLVSDPDYSNKEVKEIFEKKVEDVFTFLRDYKLPTVNKFAFDGKLQDLGLARAILDETHEEWVKLISGKVEGNAGISLTHN